MAPEIKQTKPPIHNEMNHMDTNTNETLQKVNQSTKTPPIFMYKSPCCVVEFSQRNYLFKDMNDHITKSSLEKVPTANIETHNKDTESNTTTETKNETRGEATVPQDESRELQKGQQEVETDIQSSNWQQAGTRFKCPLCRYTRNTRNQMVKHMKTHDENVDDGSYTCGICSYQNNTIDQ